MLDEFLEVAYEHEKKASAYQRMVADMGKLPLGELHALAEGTSKLASLCGESDEWLEKYEGTPFHEQALQLEQEQLEHSIAQEQRLLEVQMKEKDESREEEYRRGDAIRLRKRILDLELNKSKLEAAAGGAAEEDEEQEEFEPEAATPPVAAEEEPEEAEEAPVDIKAAAVRMRKSAGGLSRFDPAAAAVAVPTALAAGASRDPFIVPNIAGTVTGRMGRYAENVGQKPGEMGPGNAAMMGAVGGDLVGGAIGGPPGAQVGRALGAGGGAYLGYSRSKDKAKDNSGEKKGPKEEVKKASACGVTPVQLRAMRKEALNLGGAMKGLANAGRAGFRGAGVAGKVGAKGLAGASKNVGKAWAGMAKNHPGMAAASLAIPTAAAAGGVGLMAGRASR